MKKFAVAVLLAVLVLAMAGCSCEHEWAQADCVTPKTCSLCGEIEGAPRGHVWKAATCEAPKTCTGCGLTNGEALGHTFADATCETPKTCTACGTADGDALGHQWVDATYEAPKTCSVCAATEGEILVRTDLGDMNALTQQLNTLLQAYDYQLKYYGQDNDGWPIYDIVSVSTGEYAKAYVSFHPSQDGTRALEAYLEAEDPQDTTAVTVMGVAAGIVIKIAEPEFDENALTAMLSGEPTSVDAEAGIAYYYMEDMDLSVEMQVSTEYAVFWIYPAE